MDSSEASWATAVAELVEHPHEELQVLCVQAPRATRLSCRGKSVVEGFMPSMTEMPGGSGDLGSAS